MSDLVFRKGQSVLLRPLERTDIPTARRWMNDPEVTQFLLRTLPLMEKEEEEWLERLSGSRHEFAFGIVHRADAKLIGTIGLGRVDWIHRTAVTGTIIGDKAYWGKGCGTEAKMLLLDFAFNALDLYAVESRVLAFNGRSLKYAEKCGYKKVGCIPRWIRGKDGERHDEIILVVTQEEWRPLWREYLNRREARRE